MTIGTAGSKVTLSKIVLGTTYYGTDIPDDTSFELLDEYYRLGGRTIDTARVYGQTEDHGVSKSELLIGKWLRERGLRDEITLITKGCHSKHEDMLKGRLTPDELRRDFDDSLASLGVDHVDLYFLHRDDEKQPVGPIMDALDKLVKSGKIRAVGASNWKLGRILEANAYAKANNKTPFSISQIQWSIASCSNAAWGDPTLVFMDKDQLRRYIAENLPIMAFSSQAKGLFSKYLANPDAAITPKGQRFFNPENMRKADVIKKICDKTGASPAAVTIAYITSHKLPAAAIVGCKNVDQLSDSMSGRDLVLSADMIDMMEKA